MRGGAFLKGKEGRVGFRKSLLLGEKAMPMSAMKARFQIAECSSLYQKRGMG